LPFDLFSSARGATVWKVGEVVGFSVALSSGAFAFANLGFSRRGTRHSPDRWIYQTTEAFAAIWLVGFLPWISMIRRYGFGS